MATFRLILTFRIDGEPLAETPWEATALVDQHQLLNVLEPTGDIHAVNTPPPGATALRFTQQASVDPTGNLQTHPVIVGAGGLMLSTSLGTFSYTTTTGGRIQGIICL